MTSEKYSSFYIEEKITTLLEVEGLTEDEAIENALFDSGSPGICMNKYCDYTTEIEPDSRSGYCERCGTNTVWSLFELML